MRGPTQQRVGCSNSPVLLQQQRVDRGRKLLSLLLELEPENDIALLLVLAMLERLK